MMQVSGTDDFSDSYYEEVDMENSGIHSSICSLIEDDCSLIDTVYSAPVKEIPEASQDEINMFPIYRRIV
ncbi:hypothetical protein TNCV_824261 [Trichonephila clavipes]|nr:hypothetical protein TNCV_824261 [Trichonephila clavipes]